MDSEKIDATTLLIYDVALDHTRWPSLLQCLANLFNAHFADSFERTWDYSRYGGVVFGLDDRDYHEQLLGQWVTRNVWGKRRPVKRAGDIVTTRDIMPATDFMRTEMYNEYLAPRDLHEGLRLDIWVDEVGISDISVIRPWSAGPYTDAERRVAALLLPHLQRSAAVSRRLQRYNAVSAASLAALEHMQTGIVLMDRQGRVVHQNQVASVLLAQADGLSLDREGLAAATPALTRKLQAMIAAAAGTPTVAARSDALSLPRPSGLASLSLIITPLRRDLELYATELSGTAAIMLCISDPSAGADRRLSDLAALFKLTPAEAAVAADLLAGLELRDIAKRRGRSVNTIRTQLVRLMDKTDTRRQAELVSRLATAGGSTLKPRI